MLPPCQALQQQQLVLAPAPERPTLLLVSFARTVLIRLAAALQEPAVLLLPAAALERILLLAVA